jgi:hypothetical protein
MKQINISVVNVFVYISVSDFFKSKQFEKMNFLIKYTLKFNNCLLQYGVQHLIILLQDKIVFDFMF